MNSFFICIDDDDSSKNDDELDIENRILGIEGPDPIIPDDDDESDDNEDDGMFHKLIQSFSNSTRTIY